jgi:hypothetical protein
MDSGGCFAVHDSIPNVSEAIWRLQRLAHPPDWPNDLRHALKWSSCINASNVFRNNSCNWHKWTIILTYFLFLLENWFPCQAEIVAFPPLHCVNNGMDICHFVSVFDLL